MSSFQIEININKAIANHKPVVALESTVITHGLPYPENLQLALDMEEVVSKAGALPATISIVDGVVKIGTKLNDLEFLSKTKGLKKISVRDYGPAIAKKDSGGTTVAGTLIAANKAGIKVMATGGIGGVHRRSSHDISPDLVQLSRTPMILVCAGAKSILDLPATIEKLETLGIPVVGYKTDEFPAFYSRESGLPVTARADSPKDVVEIAKAHWSLGLQSTVLVVAPPPEEDAMNNKFLDSIINEALDEMEAKGITGQGVTPYLLNAVKEKTGGKSLKTNLSLLKNNAFIAAEIAKELFPNKSLSA